MQVSPQKVQVLLLVVPAHRPVGRCAARRCFCRSTAALDVVVALTHRGQDLVEEHRRKRSSVIGYSVGDNKVPPMDQAST